MIKNIFKLKNLSILIALAGLAYGGYYFGTQNIDTSSNNKTLELTTVAIQKGDLAKKEEYNGTLRQTDKKVLNSPTNGVVTFLPKELETLSSKMFFINLSPINSINKKNDIDKTMIKVKNFFITSYYII